MSTFQTNNTSWYAPLEREEPRREEPKKKKRLSNTWKAILAVVGALTLIAGLIPARLAAEIGQTVGRWIYIVDAADDLGEDRAHRRFNPYSGIFADPPTEQDAEMLRTRVEFTRSTRAGARSPS